MGHTSKSVMCKGKVNEIEEEYEEEIEEDDNLQLGLIEDSKGEFVINVLKTNASDMLRVKLLLDSKYVEMEVDSGGVRSVIHEQDYERLFSNLVLEPVTFKLRVVTGEMVTILGQIFVYVTYADSMYYLPLVVLQSHTPFIPLLGRNWLNVLNKNWRDKFLDSVSQINTALTPQKKEVQRPISNNECNMVVNRALTASQRPEFLGSVREELICDIKSKFGSLFLDEPNSFIKGFKAEIKVKDNFKPIFHRAYEMPYALKIKVEDELNNLLKS
uniref:Uncharacterized protein LOC114329865 n=1 Tax=Diabrotica virgifera virgifera TaxID=50390 RepID=A0A6P7FPP3_DIAVI